MVHNINMMDYENIPKQCKICKLYEELYKIDGAIFKPFAGTCKYKYRMEYPCDDFIEKPSIKIAVEDTLREINEHLTQIEMLLKQEQETANRKIHKK